MAPSRCPYTGSDVSSVSVRSDATIFEPYLSRWALSVDGMPFRSRSSDLVFVRSRSGPAILKVPFETEERLGGALMHWWGGDGAARVFHFDAASGTAVLERASGPRDLRRMSERGEDAEAVRILCRAASRLHRAGRGPRPSELVPLDAWFAALPRAAQHRGGPFASGWAVAKRLLAQDRHTVALHGDIHHGNVLDFGTRGWLAIDPKHVFGDRTFDYVNILRNPDVEAMPDPARFERTVAIVVSEAGLDRRRYLEWTYAFAMLSAAWNLEDDSAPSVDFEIAKLAAVMLGSIETS